MTMSKKKKREHVCCDGEYLGPGLTFKEFRRLSHEGIWFDIGCSCACGAPGDGHANLLLATIGDGASKRLAVAGLVGPSPDIWCHPSVIEDVSAMPKQGVSSSSRFGRATGAIEGALSALMVPTMFVRPAVWKRSLGASASSKENCRALAAQRWPNQQDLFRLHKHHNRDEAALLGLWFIQRYARGVAA
jgi:hypothetical protein